MMDIRQYINQLDTAIDILHKFMHDEELNNYINSSGLGSSEKDRHLGIDYEIWSSWAELNRLKESFIKLSKVE